MSILEIKADGISKIVEIVCGALGITAIAIKKNALAQAEAHLMIGHSNPAASTSFTKRNDIIDINSPDDSSRYNCYSGKNVTPEMVKQAVEIDHLVYPAKYQASLDLCMQWYKRNPEIYIMAKDVTTNQIVGYINAMPLSSREYNILKQGEIIDNIIENEAIELYDLPDCYSLYFSSVAIAPEYHNTSLLKSLYDAFYIKLIELSNREIFFTEILADAVSPQGEKLCKYIGMRLLCRSNHNTNIYTVCLLPPNLRVYTNMGKKIVGIYQSYYEEFVKIIKQSEMSELKSD